MIEAKRYRKGTIAFAGLSGSGVAVILGCLALIVGDIIVNGLPQLSWSFLTEAPRDGMTAGGIFPAIFGTVLLVLQIGRASCRERV